MIVSQGRRSALALILPVALLGLSCSTNSEKRDERLAQAEALTRQRRPDLWAVYETGEAPEQSDANTTAGKAGKDKDEDR